MSRKVLLIDDDRMQFRLTHAHFGQFRSEPFELEWADNYEDGLRKLLAGGYAACLLDYQLGPRDGLALLEQAVAGGCRVPIIFLTAETEGNVDLRALDAGALDYLIKGEINTRTLERSLRYALKLGETLEALRLAATHDPLTGVLNRRAFEHALAEESERSGRFGHPFGLVSIDIDHFKTVNDTYGHEAGDEVLKGVAKRIAKQIRTVDRLARIGGEEFIVLVPETETSGVTDFARRVVAAMAAEPIARGDGHVLAVTISAGSAGWPKDAADAAGLLRAADHALYSAKRDGRNRAAAFGGVA